MRKPKKRVILYVILRYIFLRYIPKNTQDERIWESWLNFRISSKKIYEAYADFIKSGITPELNARGKYVIHGYTSEGIKIEMIITQKGHMKTAYPIITKGL